MYLLLNQMKNQKMRSHGSSDFMFDLIAEALEGAMIEIEDAVGLTLVPEKSFISLYAGDDKLIARVPSSSDPMSDVDRIRSFWFSTARNLTNELWD